MGGSDANRVWLRRLDDEGLKLFVNWEKLQFPKRCVCCLQPTDQARDLEFRLLLTEETRSGAALEVITRRTSSKSFAFRAVPYCDAHLEELDRRLEEMKTRRGIRDVLREEGRPTFHRGSHAGSGLLGFSLRYNHPDATLEFDSAEYADEFRNVNDLMTPKTGRKLKTGFGTIFWRELKKPFDQWRGSSFKLKRVTESDVKRWRAKGDVPALVALLQYRDSWVRIKAALALGELGNDAGVAPMLELLAGKHGGDQRGAALALGQLRDRRAVEPLLAALADWPNHMRVDAARALGQLGDPRAVSPLIAARASNDRWVADAATQALDELRERVGEEAFGLELRRASQDEARAGRDASSRTTDEPVPTEQAGAPDARLQERDPTFQRFFSTRDAPVEDGVQLLIWLYEDSPQGFAPRGGLASVVRGIAIRLNALGGLSLMRDAHTAFARHRPDMAGNLDVIWRGIGHWSSTENR